MASSPKCRPQRKMAKEPAPTLRWRPPGLNRRRRNPVSSLRGQSMADERSIGDATTIGGSENYEVGCRAEDVIVRPRMQRKDWLQLCAMHPGSLLFRSDHDEYPLSVPLFLR